VRGRVNGYHAFMAKQKVTLTLQAEDVKALRRLAGAPSLSAAVQNAVDAYVERLRHLSAVDEWLAEMEREHGPIPGETVEWGARVVDEWERTRRSEHPPS
jgi:hypothetical protein